MTTVERFFALVHKDRASGCWLWTGAKNKSLGFGLFKTGLTGAGHNVMTNAHRVSWMLHNGPLQEFRRVFQSCGVRSCVNPSHLELGHELTGKRTVTVCNERPCHGEEHLCAGMRPHNEARIPMDVIRAIRAEYASGGVTQKALAIKYGASPSYVHRLVHGENRRES